MLLSTQKQDNEKVFINAMRNPWSSFAVMYREQQNVYHLDTVSDYVRKLKRGKLLICKRKKKSRAIEIAATKKMYVLNLRHQQQYMHIHSCYHIEKDFHLNCSCVCILNTWKLLPSFHSALISSFVLIFFLLLFVCSIRYSVLNGNYM